MLKLQSSGARNFNHYRTKDMPKLSGAFVWQCVYMVFVSTLLDNKPPDLLTMDFIKEEQNSDGSVRLPAVTPFLGRGLLPGTEVDLTSSLKPNMSTAKVVLCSWLQLRFYWVCVVAKSYCSSGAESY